MRKLTAAQDLSAHWNAFCDADYFEGSEDFAERMEDFGLIRLTPVTKDALQESFAADRGIERGGMMWELTTSGRKALASMEKEGPQ